MSKIYGGGTTSMLSPTKKPSMEMDKIHIPVLNSNESLKNRFFFQKTLQKSSSSFIHAKKRLEDQSVSSLVNNEKSATNLYQSQSINLKRPTTSHKKATPNFRKERITLDASRQRNHEYTLNTGDLNLETININKAFSDSSFSLIDQQNPFAIGEAEKHAIFHESNKKKKNRKKNSPNRKSQSKILQRYTDDFFDDGDESNADSDVSQYFVSIILQDSFSVGKQSKSYKIFQKKKFVEDSLDTLNLDISNNISQNRKVEPVSWDKSKFIEQFSELQGNNNLKTEPNAPNFNGTKHVFFFIDFLTS
jgi:hypothetical protein